MKAVLIRSNKNIEYFGMNLIGYKFIPKRKNIDSIIIINNNLIKEILVKRLNKDINNLDKAISLMIKSIFTEIGDCNIMEKEILRIINILNNKYFTYLNEFEYFDYIKRIYLLNNVINLKKKLILM